MSTFQESGSMLLGRNKPKSAQPEFISFGEIVNEFMGTLSSAIERVDRVVADVNRKSGDGGQPDAASITDCAKQYRSELDEIRGAIQEVQDELDTIRCMLTSDDLTGALGRRCMEQAILREMSRASRYGSKLSLCRVGIADLEGIGERHGEATRDKAVLHLADIIRNSLRGSDSFARAGKDEFVLILPDTDEVGASFVTEIIRLQVNRTPFTAGGGEHILQFHAGVAEAQGFMDLETLLSMASVALAQAKNAHNFVTVKASGYLS